MEQIIAIDPDLDKNGVCVISHNRVELFTFNYTTLCYVFFKNIRAQMDANLSLKTHLFIEAGFKNKVYFQPYNTNTFVIGKINRNIGENHAISKIILESAEFYHLNPIPALPVRSTNYRTRGKKITHPQFLKMLELNNLFFEGNVTNQETRDAALLAVTYGINKENNVVLKDENKKATPQFYDETIDEGASNV
ncbi:MAG: hypothetical protein II393_00420 [Cytophagales bacterium]|nr:hypothetical protein [Cytophagales bacterium]